MPIIDDRVAVLAAEPANAGDLAGLEKQVRIVGVIARSAKAVVALTPAPKNVSDPDPEEDEMKHRDDSPENLERMRADLEVRLDHLGAAFESKGLALEAGCWPVARPEQEPVHAA